MHRPTGKDGAGGRRPGRGDRGSAHPGSTAAPSRAGRRRADGALFASGYAGCFHAALLGAARARKVDVAGSSVGARVGLQRDGDSIGPAVDLEVVLPDLAQELADLAHANCPYSKAVRGDIRVTVDVADY